MTKPRHVRRKTIIINPKLQKRIIRSISTVPAMALFLMMFVVCIFCYEAYQEATKLGIQFDGMLPLFIAVAGFVVTAAMYLITTAILTSHRVAGPAYRLCESLKRVREIK